MYFGSMRSRVRVRYLLLGLCGLAVLSDAWVWWRGRQRILPAPRGNAPACIVVPGASVYRDGRLSPILKERMDAALLALRAWTSSQLLLSGTAIQDGYDEVTAMRRYAINKGFDSTRIRLDRKGDNTVQTIGNLRSTLQSSQKAVIVSQTWHLPRALWLGENIDLHGLACNPDTSRQGVIQQGREHLARIENFWRVMLPF